MKKSKIEFSKVITPTDCIAAVVIIVGLVISIFVDQIEVRLIGISVSVLGVVALFMLISQRVKDMIDSKMFKRSGTAPELKITHSKSTQASRQIFEDLDTSLNNDYDKVSHSKEPAPKEEPIKVSVQPKDFSNGEEGFKVIRKKKNADTPAAENRAESLPKAKIHAKPAETVSAPKSEAIPETKPEVSPEVEVTPEAKTETKPSAVSKVEDVKTALENAHIDLFATPEFTQQDAAPDKSYKEIAESVKSDLQIPLKPATKPAEPEPEKQACHANVVEVPDSILVDETIATQEPRDEFATFVSRAMLAIRSMTSTTTIAFFIVNTGRKNLLLETFVTDVPDAIIDIPKIPMSDNVVSRIAQSGKAEILTDISPSAELDLLPYYKRPVGSVAFIGLPIYYKNSVLGVLCADSTTEDAFDNFTVGFFGHFTKIIGSLVMNFTEKYELQQAARVLKVIAEIRDLIATSGSSLETIADAFITSCKDIFDYLNLGMVCFDGATGEWRVLAFDNTVSDTNLVGSEIDLDFSIIGETLRRGVTLDLPIKPNSPVCVHKSEDKLSKGYFVSSPIISTDTVYGALFITGKSQAHVTNYDVNILNTLGEHIGMILEQLHIKQVLENTALIDPYSGILSLNGFAQRIYEEVERHNKFAIPMCVCAFKLDHYVSINPEEHPQEYNAVLSNVLEQFRTEVKPYDLFGKGEDNIFYIVLSGMRLTEAQLWAERIRSQVAGRIINVGKKKFSITLSGGIAQLGDNDSVDSIMKKTHQVLDLAIKKNNNIKIFA